MNNVFILILAGGEGTRFAPLSTPERPKQFLNFIGEGTFIQQTYRRARGVADAENIFVATNERYVSLVREQLPDVPAQNIIGEPFKKNTAPALAYCASLIHERDPLATMICLPSDHHISDEDGFNDVLLKGVSLARDGYLVTLGMKPGWPSTDYGYISPKKSGSEWSDVARFVEKPDRITAENYLREGFLWNGGIFIWQTKMFLDEIKEYAPNLLPVTDHWSPITYFTQVPSISIDYALMEKSTRVAVIPCDIGWSDVGTWESLNRLSNTHGVRIAPEAMKMMQKNV